MCTNSVEHIDSVRFVFQRRVGGKQEVMQAESCSPGRGFQPLESSHCNLEAKLDGSMERLQKMELENDKFLDEVNGK